MVSETNARIVSNKLANMLNASVFVNAEFYCHRYEGSGSDSKKITVSILPEPERIKPCEQYTFETELGMMEWFERRLILHKDFNHLYEDKPQCECMFSFRLFYSSTICLRCGLPIKRETP